MSRIRKRWTGDWIRDAVEMSASRRLRNFICEESQDAIRMFTPELREQNASGDWYGEHAGKWLRAASSRLKNVDDEALRNQLRFVANALIECQEANGYCGAYALDATCRMTHSSGANQRTWDVWVHAYCILGLISAYEVEPNEAYLQACTKIGDLICDTFDSDIARVLQYGNHQGLSALVIIQPLVQISKATGNSKYADFAWHLLHVAETHGLHFLSGEKNNLDVSQIGTGKIYQILWCLCGMSELADWKQDEDLCQVIRYWYHNVCEFHLNPLGGPWGGIGTHKEVFNAQGFFDPAGMVETCSTATWLELSLLLFHKTKDCFFLDNWETALMNALLGALDYNGEDWCYFTFPNGRRNYTYFWACCKSSGLMALQESANGVGDIDGETVSWYGFYSAEMTTLNSERFSISWSEELQRLDLYRSRSDKSVRVRIPSWATLIDLDASCQIENGWLIWPGGIDSQQSLHVNIELKVIPYTHTVDHHGQEIVREDYACVKVGPFVYCLGLIDGLRKHESLPLPRLDPKLAFEPKPDREIHLKLPGRLPLLMVPYSSPKVSQNATWRTTWLEVAWQ